MQDLKQRTIRGGFAKLCSQAAVFGLRLGSLMVLGRLLEPRDFGLVGMVLAVVGALNMLKDFGISTATVQHSSVTDDQHSTLFWINLLVGAALSLLCAGMAPAIAVFYHEPRVQGIAVVLGMGFLFNAAGVQHSAILQREMRFTTTATIDVAAQAASVAAGIGLAVAGAGYWALAGMAVTAPLVSTVGLWLSSPWKPGMPKRGSGVRSMMRFGCTITLNGIVVYIAYNLEKALLGRYWGADAIGIYGRAYQLISIPTENLNSATGGVALAALSRLRDDPKRFKDYFLKGYSLLLALTVPITILCGLFADDLIFVVLGPKWNDAAVIFRLLAPTILIFALINPLAWLMFSLGLVGRSLRVALVLGPLVIAGYIIGLPYGPKGVALGYSAVMILWSIPHIAWCVRDTGVALADILRALSRPLLCGVAAAAASVATHLSIGASLPPVARLGLGGTVFLGAYLGMLLYAMKQKDPYLDLLRTLRKRTPAEDDTLVPA